MLGSILKKKIHNEKGFTLAELLVVIAILAILVAISIPIFTSRLNEAKKATDESNIRAAKALVSSEILSGDAKPTYYYDAEKGSLEDASTNIKAYGQSSEKIEDSSTDTVPYNKILKFTVNGSNITYEWVSP